MHIGTVVLAIVVSAGSVARADDAHDALSLTGLQMRSLALSRDINDSVVGALTEIRASGDTRTPDCLGSLRDTGGEISDVLDGVAGLAIVTAEMNDPRDEKVASSYRNIYAKGALDRLRLDRRTVNQVAGECANQLLVQNKARDLIQLIDDASVALGSLKSAGD